MNPVINHPPSPPHRRSLLGKIIAAAIWCFMIVKFYNSTTSSMPSIDGQNEFIKNTTKIPTLDYKVRYPTCNINPFQNSVKEDFNDIIKTAEKWLFYQEAFSIFGHDTMFTEHNHARFYPFQEMANCSDLQCLGGPCSSDNSKYVCGMQHLSTLDTCVVYSIGGANRWTFEQDVLSRTKCEVHTFDCTGGIERFQVPANDRLHFHYICLGATSAKGEGGNGDMMTLEQIQTQFGHGKIDLLKMDIEQWEWQVLDIEETNATMPMQVLVEVHYQGYAIHDKPMTNATDIVRLQGNLLRMGYVVAHRDDNPKCKHCTELTLLRVAC